MAQTSEGSVRARRILMIVENLSAPADPRLWAEAALLSRNHYEVSVICPRRRAAELSEQIVDGIRVFRHPSPFRTSPFLRGLLGLPLALLWQFVLACRIARRVGFDVVHVCNPPNAVFFVGMFFKVFARKAILFDYRDADLDHHERGFENTGTWTERFALKRADSILAVNESHRRVAIKRGNRSPDKVLVFRSCPDPERVAARRPDPLWRNGRTYLVAYAGEVSSANGLDILIKAIEHVVYRQQRTDIQFVIAGAGREWNEIASSCGRLNLSDYVTFTGSVDDETLFTILSTADVCVDPRPLTTTNALFAGEYLMTYMAIGKPIVQFAIPEGRLVAEQASSYAADNDPAGLAHEVIQLIDNPEIRKIMEEYGKRRIHSQFSWSGEQKKLLSAYEALIVSQQSTAADKSKLGEKPTTAKQ